mmetsp:Transcript_34563/g.73637  ORF Transcript_34563/g.73637 Transcript_34563/m.73637 type:complete len:331 (+) Transcript_34563:13-1005(+)
MHNSFFFISDFSMLFLCCSRMVAPVTSRYAFLRVILLFDCMNRQHVPPPYATSTVEHPSVHRHAITPLIRALQNGLVVEPHDGAPPHRTVLLPECLRQRRRVLLLQVLRRPGLERGQAHPLRLRRAVRPRPRLREVLLVVRLGEVPQPSVLVVVRRGGDFGLDLPPPQRLLVGRLARLDQPPLIVVEVVGARAVLASPIVSLSHVLRGIVALPEHPQDVHVRNLLGIVHHPEPLRVPRHARARLVVGGIGRVSRAVSHGRGVDALGQAPDGLLAPPEASVPEDSHLESVGDLLELVPEDVVPEAVDAGHLLGPALHGLVGRDHAAVAAGE